MTPIALFLVSAAAVILALTNVTELTVTLSPVPMVLGRRVRQEML
jgi:hypothetical protein